MIDYSNVSPDRRRNFEVDMVYLWVNGADPVWQAKRAATVGEALKTSATDCKGRYTDNGELRYSLRSIAQYAPWIRRIFIVTDNQVPEWLDTDHPRIRIVDHTEILPPECLPCFNSVIIEHFLHRIPGLGQHFLYANDNTLLNRPVLPADFFTWDGLPIFRFYRKRFRKLSLWYRTRVLKKKLGNYNQQIKNAADLVEAEYGDYFGSRLHHNIDSYLKSDHSRIYEEHEEIIRPTLCHHVRHDADISHHLYAYVSLAEGHARVQYVTDKTSFRLQIHETDRYRKLERCNPMFFCMNDSQFATDADRERSIEYLRKRFPDKSEFEK